MSGIIILVATTVVDDTFFVVYQALTNRVVTQVALVFRGIFLYNMFE